MTIQKKNKLLEDLLDVNYSFNYFEFDDLFEEWKHKKSYFIYGLDEDEIRLNYECYIFYHYCLYSKGVLSFINKIDIQNIIMMKRKINDINDDDLLYLYGFYKLSISDLLNLDSTQESFELLKIQLQQINVFYEINEGNFKSLTFLYWVKQGSRRNHLSDLYILNNFQNFLNSENYV